VRKKHGATADVEVKFSNGPGLRDPLPCANGGENVEDPRQLTIEESARLQAGRAGRGVLTFPLPIAGSVATPSRPPSRC
jgi:hypothetical protein